MTPYQTGRRMRALDHQGFTLIELMVTVALIGVLAGLSAATWFTGLNHASLRSDARDIASALRTAKQHAITENIPYQVYFDITNSVYEVESCASGCTSAPVSYFSGSGNTHGSLVGSLVILTTASSGHKPINIKKIVDSANFTYSSGNFRIQFVNNGTATFSSGSSAVVTVARTDGNSETKVINVNSMGRVQVP